MLELHNSASNKPSEWPSPSRTATAPAGNCARSALTCLNCTIPEGITSRAATVPAGNCAHSALTCLYCTIPRVIDLPSSHCPGWNCARSALTCLYCTIPAGINLPGSHCPGRKLCAQRTDLLELHNSASNKPSEWPSPSRAATAPAGNCARSALTCLYCTIPAGINLPGSHCPGRKLCAQRTDLLELHNSGRHNLLGGYCPGRKLCAQRTDLLELHNSGQSKSKRYKLEKRKVR